MRLSYAAPPTIDSLGALPGGTGSVGFAINGSGQVAGYGYATGAPPVYHAFRYTGTPGGGGVMHDLGTLGGPDSQGNAINASGQVTGYSNTTAFPPVIHAFRYTGTPGSGGVMHDLGTLGGSHSAGSSINASGQVAGWSSTTGDAALHAFRYTGTPGGGGVMHDLGGFEARGNAINASGQVAGYSAGHAFLYTGTPGSGGAMHDLGTLGGEGEASWGAAINDAGQVTGMSSIGEEQHTFLYTGMPGNGGAMHDLGALFGGRFSRGNAINAGGQVVGSSETFFTNQWRAFLYTGTPGVDGQMIDLDAWLDANNPEEGAKWILLDANGVNDAGLITGFGAYNDGPGGLSDGDRAFILDASALIVPEPGGLALLGLAVPVLLRRRARRTRKSGR